MSLRSMRGSIGFLPSEVLLWGSVGIVLLVVWSIQGGMCTPMLFTKQTMVLPATYFGDPFIKGNHFPLRGVA